MAQKEIVLGGGCFWCLEAVFSRVKGVLHVRSGYAGGKRENPSYEQVCSGATGHAEVVKITYDTAIISLDELLGIFWEIHNPTTLNAQGADVGTQYRSVIYYENEDEKKIIECSKEEANGRFEDAIVTEVSALPEFYPAEEYHQNYFFLHPEQGYCQVVIAPKVQKFMSHFQEKVR